MQRDPKKNTAETATRQNRLVYRRTVLLMVLCGILVFIPLVIQLYNIQIVNHEVLQERAVAQQTRDMKISPMRGTIYDRNMKPLALSASVHTVVIAPKTLQENKQVEVAAAGLSQILGVDLESITKKAKKTNSMYEIIKKKVEDVEYEQVLKFISENKINGVYLEPDAKRYYPYGNFASHVIGFVNSDNEGLAGIESMYEKYLKGTPGRIISAKNARGTDMPFKYQTFYDAQNGLGVVLTIDETIQHFLERNLENAVIENRVLERSTGIVVNVKTMEVLAMATKPDFDLNSPWTLSDPGVLSQIEALPEDEQSDARYLAQQAMWRNKAIVDTYEPGSTFKILTTAMALEEKKVTPDDQFFCSGSMRIPGRATPVSCWKKEGHGAQTFAQGIQNSCNPVFMTVGQRIGREPFYNYMKAFGLMNKTGIDLPGEAVGIVADYNTFSRSVVPLSIYSFGQTFKITPIELITAVSSVVNGGYLMKPYMVKELVDTEGVAQKVFEPETVRQVISQETSKLACELLEKVVTIGTGKSAYVKGFRVGGKTGTGEKIDLRPKSLQMGNYVVSFMAFAPADDPQIAVLILLDHPSGMANNLRTGGRLAAPLAGRIMADVLPYIGVEPQYSEEEMQNLDVVIPNLVGLGKAEIEKQLKEKKIAYKFVGDAEVSTDQIPAVGTKIPRSSEVVIYMGKEKASQEIHVPNLAGMSPTNANRTLVNLGLYMKSVGATGTKSTSIICSAQTPEAGTAVKPGAVVEVQFIDNSIVGDR